MTETVDQAQTRPPRALAGIIEDAWRATGGHCWADRDGAEALSTRRLAAALVRD